MPKSELPNEQLSERTDTIHRNANRFLNTDAGRILNSAVVSHYIQLEIIGTNSK